MALTDSFSEISQELYDYLVAGKTDLGLQDVWYDISGLVPRTPAIMLEPQSKSRDLTQTGSQTTNTFDVSIILIHSRMASESVTNAESLALAEEVEEYLHDNRRLNGKLVHSYVVSLEQGSVTQQNVLLRATRLMWRGISRTRM